ncbi:MAG: glycosyltransferase family 4 protein [Acidobacteriota bacterium]
MNGKLRLLLVVHGFPPRSVAGTELYAYYLAGAMRRRGHSVRVLHPEQDPNRPEGAVSETLQGDLPVSRINTHPRCDLAGQFLNEPVARGFSDYLASLDVDLVHFQHLIGLSATAIAACRERNVPSVLTAHDSWLLCEQPHFIRPDGSFCESGPESVDKCVSCFLDRHGEMPVYDHLPEVYHAFALRRKTMLEAFSMLDTVVTPTHFLRRSLEDHGFTHDRLVLSPLGLAALPPVPRRPRAPGEPLRLGFFGNVYFTKGLDVLIRALNLIDPRGASLDIHGNVADPDYFRSVMGAIGPGRTVRYRGGYSPGELPEILSRTDVAVVPSRAENYPFVVRECLHAGVPVIASRVGGIPEIVTDGENGLLFAPGDHEDLARRINLLIEAPERAEALRRGIRPIRTIADEAAQLESIYRYTLATRQDSRKPSRAGKNFFTGSMTWRGPGR